MPDLAREQQLAALHAVAAIQDGMLVGLGTGRTAAFAIEAIAARMREGLRIRATATSTATEALATRLGIPLVPFATLARVDLTIDGADEIDAELRAIKGGGGALTREKVIAAASDSVIVIVDSSKPVATLGRAKLPVEVLSFAALWVRRALDGFGVPVSLRTGEGGAPYLTDQQAHIYDLEFGLIDDPATVARRIEAIPGVIGHGLFLDEIDTLIVAEGEAVRVVERAH